VLAKFNRNKISIPEILLLRNTMDSDGESEQENDKLKSGDEEENCVPVENKAGTRANKRKRVEKKDPDFQYSSEKEEDI
jgi:hypothetical protein